MNTTLLGDHDATTQVMTFADTSAITSFPYTVVIDSEVIAVRGLGNAGEVYVDRGREGSTRASHAANAAVTLYTPVTVAGVDTTLITWPAPGGSWVVAGPSVTLITKAHRVRVSHSLMAYANTGSEMYLTLMVDGVNVGDATYGLWVLTGTTAWGARQIDYLSDVLVAGQHTFVLYCKTGGGNSIGVEVGPRLSVDETFCG